MKIVIGLIGAKGAGKTTAFDVIKDELGVQEITLAAKLKDTCSKVFSVPRDHFDSHAFKEKDLDTPVNLNPLNLVQIFKEYDLKVDFNKYLRSHIGKILYTPRQIAQYVGTEVLRAYSPDIHCDWACKAITQEVGVVTDMRFPNEFDYFYNNFTNFYSIYVQNTGAEIKASKDSHASEAHIKDLGKRAQITIHNNGDLKTFQDTVRLFTKEIV